MEKPIIRNKFDRLKSRLLLVTAVFFLNYLLFFLIDREYAAWMLSGEMTLGECAIDAVLTLLYSFLFVEISVFYCKCLFRYMSFSHNPYHSLFIYAILLLILNNLTALGFSLLVGLFEDSGFSFFHQMMYIVSVIVTFVSYVYTNARYMDFIVASEKQKKELEISLLKEKEHTAQMQLEVLKAQINPHFMFNNFSILSELIMEDHCLAEKFLDNLSKVYRYVIQNLKRDTIPISEEIVFLRSYIYLMQIRYGDAVRIEVDDALEYTNGMIPPTSLQLLVENAIKHNSMSRQIPLSIRIYCKGNDVVVENDLHPVASNLTSTGIGHRNIIERYFLLCKRKPVIEKQDKKYIVKLPIIYNESYEHTDNRR